MSHPAKPARTAVLTIGALGVVYGDIGTSPLYAFREALGAGGGLTIDERTILGIVSLIFWSLVIVISVKYIGFILSADNHGEGGILALTALVLPGAPKRWAGTVALVGLFGTALIYGDGIITPSISVLSAVEGFGEAHTSFEPFVIPAAAGILVALFSIQHRGTGLVGAIFGPIMVVWFGLLAVLGLAQVAQEPRVLEAAWPGYAAEFCLHSPHAAFLALGSVFLVVTGGEALYADLGHFGRRPIIYGWFTLVFPALLLNYAGQGALLLGHPEKADNPFYLMAPAWGVFPLAICATLATVIASQALISGAASLTMQAVQMDYVPRVRIDHTSLTEQGQIYVPLVNWALMVACVTLVFTFRTSSNLASAYGIAVTATMLITTVLFYILARRSWHWSRLRAGALTCAFVLVDVSFLSANLVKIPSGGWFPLAVALALVVLMTTWRRGRELVARQFRDAHVPLQEFLTSLSKHPPERVPGTIVYLHRDATATPPGLLSMLRATQVLPETIVITSVTFEDAPRVPAARRSEATELGQGVFQVSLRFGFMDQPDVPKALTDMIAPHLVIRPETTTYVLGVERVVPTDKPGMATWREHLFALVYRNAAPAALMFRLPSDRVIEVGQQVEI